MSQEPETNQVNGIVTENHSLSANARFFRAILFAALTRLEDGFMKLYENGHLARTFGNADSDLHAELDIKDPAAYRKLILGGSVASGETYMEGMWDSPDLTQVIRIFARNLDVLDAWEKKFKWIAKPFWKLQHFLRRNSLSQARRNIQAHYDLGNLLYSQFLDDTMMYSAAIYPHTEASLREAQLFKLKTICDKLMLTADDHLVEIGAGWGGLAVYAAKHYGCRVTTTTISDEQYDWAKEWIAREQLGHLITLHKKDYRLLEGKYDKLVSIEMIEAVGKDYLPEFFKKCNSLLKDDGVMLLQAITIDDRRFDTYSRSVDFIQKYIFPGGFLPSQLLVNELLKKHTKMMIRDLHDIGLDYAQTLRDWHVYFDRNKHRLTEHGYDERFMRMWRYYLNYCEGGFLERTISTVQLVVSKPGFRCATIR